MVGLHGGLGWGYPGVYAVSRLWKGLGLRNFGSGMLVLGVSKIEKKI